LHLKLKFLAPFTLLELFAFPLLAPAIIYINLAPILIPILSADYKFC
jgi:hypothetical protein